MGGAQTVAAANEFLAWRADMLAAKAGFGQKRPPSNAARQEDGKE
jgi:hypothetical protein